jgi:hypothetical protein
VQQVSSTGFMLPTSRYVTHVYAFSLYRFYTFIGIQCPTQKQTGHCTIYERMTPANFWRGQFAGANKVIPLNLTFIAPCIANIFAEYNRQDATIHNFFIPVRRSTCFRRFFRPSLGAQNCTYSVRYLSDLLLAVQASRR